MKRIVLMACSLLSGCGTPFSLTGGFGPAYATVNFPNGIQKQVQVVQAAPSSTATLIVPTGSNLGETAVIPETNAIVPIVESNVSSPVLTSPTK